MRRLVLGIAAGSLVAAASCHLRPSERDPQPLLPPQAPSLPLHPEKISFSPLIFLPPRPARARVGKNVPLLLMVDETMPLVEVCCLVDAGSVYDPPDREGLARLAGRALRSGGTTSTDGETIEDALDRVGGRMDIDVGMEWTDVRIQVRSQDVSLALGILAGILRAPAFPEDAVGAERAFLFDELGRRDDRPAQVARRIFREIVYAGHPMGRDGLGTDATLATISREDLVSFHKTYFVPNRCAVSVAGGIDISAVTEELDDLLGDWAPDPEALPPVVIPQVPAADRGGVFLVDFPAPQSTIVAGHLGVPAGDSRRTALEVLCFILGGETATSRLGARLQSEQGLACAVRCELSSGRRRGVLYAEAQTRPGATARATGIVLRAMDVLRDSPVGGVEMDWATETLSNRFLFRFESPFDAARRFLLLDFLDLPEEELLDYPARVRRVSPDAVISTAREHLRPRQATVVVVGDVAEIGSGLSEYGPVTPIPLP